MPALPEMKRPGSMRIRNPKRVTPKAAGAAGIDFGRPEFAGPQQTSHQALVPLFQGGIIDNAQSTADAEELQAMLFL